VASQLDGIRIGEGFSGRVAETGEVVIVGQTSEDTPAPRGIMGSVGIDSQVIVPMKSKGRVIGTICVGMLSPRRFLPEEIDLLSTIAGQIASALENAYLYDGARMVADKLYKSERDYRSLFENAHDAIWFHNFDGIMLAANMATQLLTGYDVEFLIGMNVSQFLSKNELQLARKVRQKLIAGEEIEQPYEQKLRRKDGTIATVMLTSSLITFDGQPVGFQHIARDITEEIKMQDNLRFYLQQITQAQEEERKRIARELHDDTAQSLFAISRQIDNFMRSDTTLDKQQQSFLQEMRQRIGDTLQDVRRFSQDLRPSIIDDLGLLPAVQWLVKQIQDEHGVKSKLTVLGKERRFAQEVELILFRVIQEALSNVYRHARASRAEVIIEFAESSVCIMVSDNGKGFSIPDNFADLSRSGKLGLLGMQERISLLNGSIDVKSEPKKGTIVTVRASV
jgi:PAS domain S-box-containing protein